MNEQRQELFNASYVLNDVRSETYSGINNMPELTMRVDNSLSSNSSRFTISNIDSRMVSTISADSVLDFSRLRPFKRSPRKKFNHITELEFSMNE